MNKYSIQQAARKIARHGMILAKGAMMALYGSLTAGLACVAIATFTAIPTEGGYTAVCDFITAVATLIVSLGCIYAFGRTGRRKKAR